MIPKNPANRVSIIIKTHISVAQTFHHFPERVSNSMLSMRIGEFSILDLLGSVSGLTLRKVKCTGTIARSTRKRVA